MKKLIAFTLMVLLVLCNASAYADDTVYTEDTLYYTVNDGSITITGCFSKEDTVEVPNQIAGIPVNVIGKGAFAGNEYVKSVILPDTITTIEEGAFDSGITVTQKQGNSTVTDPDETDSQSTVPETEKAESASPAATKAPTATQAPSSTPTKTNTQTSSATTDNTIVLSSGGSSSNIEGTSAQTAVDEQDAVLEEDEISDTSKAIDNSGSETGDAADTQTVGNSVANEQANSGSSPAIIITIICIAVIAIAAALIIILKKKKQ